MIKNTQQRRLQGDLLKALEAHLRSLAAAGADETLLNQYSTLLSHLRRFGLEGLERRFESAERITGRQRSKKKPVVDVNSMSLDALLNLINNEETPRKELELIASGRFGVPQGSMRSFSNRRMLVDKLRTLIQNELAHATIGRLASQDSRFNK